MIRYNSEEERIQARRESRRKWKQANKDKVAEQAKKYRDNHAEEIKLKKQDYYKKNRDKILKYSSQYYQNNRGKKCQYAKQYRETNPDKCKEATLKWKTEHRYEVAAYDKEYRIRKSEELKKYSFDYNLTKHGRAIKLCADYRFHDKLHNRGECTLTPEWIEENIFNGQVCHYCGESDWEMLGCDRIDNSLPHTEDNVVPCCMVCNIKRGRLSYDDFKQKMQGND